MARKTPDDGLEDSGDGLEEMPSLEIRNIGCLATPLGREARRGKAQGEIRRLKDAAVRAGYEPLMLGRRTLRADAMAIIAIGVLQREWGDL